MKSIDTFKLKSVNPKAGDVDSPTAIDTAWINIAQADHMLRELKETTLLGLPLSHNCFKANDNALNMVIFAGEVLGYYLAAGKQVVSLHYSVRINEVKINCINQTLRSIELNAQGWNVKAAWEYGLRLGEARYIDMWGGSRSLGNPWRW